MRTNTMTTATANIDFKSIQANKESKNVIKLKHNVV